ncbi:MAG: hypothetical protein LAO78_14975 [Acidobacteriia bacterium]|nr:hypothetical protein [Terriglobia bacterium]
MLLRSAFLLITLCAGNILLAQQQAPAPPPQTARQALIEMVTGGQQAVMKHLTVEVQQLLNKAGSKSSYALAMFDSIKSQAGPDLQVFETGPVLFSINQPREHEKFEVRVENDDLSGDEDAVELSLHALRDGHEQQSDDFGAFLSHIVVNMKRQESIWRLNKIGIGLEFPLGDPAFLEKTLIKGLGHQSTGVGLVAGTNVGSKPEPAEVDIPPSQLVTLLAFAESTFAQQHVDAGFTCSLPDLSEAAKDFGLDQQLSTGIYKGYKLSLTGCEGKPAGSFQIVAEPVVQGKGAMAFCTDATHNVRIADDGRGATCLTSGKSYQQMLELDGMSSYGVDVHVDSTKIKK